MKNQEKTFLDIAFKSYFNYLNEDYRMLIIIFEKKGAKAAQNAIKICMMSTWGVLNESLRHRCDYESRKKPMYVLRVEARLRRLCHFINSQI